MFAQSLLWQDIYLNEKNMIVSEILHLVNLLWDTPLFLELDS